MQINNMYNMYVPGIDTGQLLQILLIKSCALSFMELHPHIVNTKQIIPGAQLLV